MRVRSGFSVFSALVLLSANATALPRPLSDEEREQRADLIIDGTVEEVVCDGPPQAGDRNVWRTPYRARLEVHDTQKGLAAIPLWVPFESIDYGDGPPPICSWRPIHRQGQSGRYWFAMHEGEYRQLSANSFETGADHQPLDLPPCTGFDAGAGPNPDSGIAPGSDAALMPPADTGPTPRQDTGRNSDTGPSTDAGSRSDADPEPAPDAGRVNSIRSQEVGCGCENAPSGTLFTGIFLLAAVLWRRARTLT
jgi:hypothetical protein